jgi:hypothetical protein
VVWGAFNRVNAFNVLSGPCQFLKDRYYCTRGNKRKIIHLFGYKSHYEDKEILAFSTTHQVRHCRAAHRNAVQRFSKDERVYRARSCIWPICILGRPLIILYSVLRDYCLILFSSIELFRRQISFLRSRCLYDLYIVMRFFVWELSITRPNESF